MCYNLRITGYEMKVIILTPRFTFPENGGDCVRINNIARYLRSQGHDVYLVSFFDSQQAESVGEASQIFNEYFLVRRNRLVSFINGLLALLLGKPLQIGYYFSLRFLHVVRKVGRELDPDFYVCHLIRMTPYTSLLNLREKSIVEMTDAMTKAYIRAKGLEGFSLKKLLYSVEEKRVAKFEQSVISRYPKCVVVSQSDKAFLGGDTNIEVHPNGVVIPHHISVAYDEEKIVFVGNMRTLPNQDAVIYFVERLLPLIRRNRQNAKFLIVGAEPPSRILRYDGSNGVRVTGFVRSIYEEISDACVSIAPLRMTAGVQNKVLVSMACRVPVILTPILQEGIPELLDMENCLIRPVGYQFAEAVLQIMVDHGLRDKIAESGYQLIKTKYSWESCLNGYDTVLD